MKYYKVILTYDHEVIETLYEGTNELEARIIFTQEKLNLLNMGCDDLTRLELITEEVWTND